MVGNNMMGDVFIAPTEEMVTRQWKDEYLSLYGAIWDFHKKSYVDLRVNTGKFEEDALPAVDRAFDRGGELDRTMKCNPRYGFAYKLLLAALDDLMTVFKNKAVIEAMPVMKDPSMAGGEFKEKYLGLYTRTWDIHLVATKACEMSAPGEERDASALAARKMMAGFLGPGNEEPSTFREKLIKTVSDELWNRYGGSLDEMVTMMEKTVMQMMQATM